MEGERQGIFYGWAIVAAVLFTLAVTAGLGFYNASVILSYSVEELGFSVSAVSGATALFFGISGLCGFGFSRFIERVDIRWFYGIGGVMGASALTGLRWVDSVAELYVFFALFGVSFAAAGLVPATTLIARWFARRRSVALSIASSGLSIGGIVLTPQASSLINARGLDGAGPWMGLVWIVGVIPIALLVLRSRPADKGLEPDGDPTPPEPVPVDGVSFAAATSTRFFRLLSVTYALVFLAQVGAMAHLFNLVNERLGTSTADRALQILAASSVVGRLAGGVVVTRLATKRLTLVLVLVQALALTLIAWSGDTGPILLSSALFGLSVGNLLMLQPLLLAETFGVKDYSRIYSLNQLMGTIGVAGGPFLLGFLRDHYDYEVAFLIGAALNLCGFAALVAAGAVDTARDEAHARDDLVPAAAVAAG